MRWLLLLLLLTGCTRVVHVPQTQTHVEYHDRVQRDSVFVRDSIIVLARGDTVFIHRDRWRDRIHTERDTVVRTDSIPYPVEVVRTEKRIPRLYRWSLWVAIAALLLLIKKLVL